MKWDKGLSGHNWSIADKGKTRKPQVLRFNPKTNELWAGRNVMSKIKQ